MTENYREKDTFELGKGARCHLPTLLETRMLVQANSGGGKSWCLRRILEQTHGRVQHLVIDPEGEFVSLRERFDYLLVAHRGGDTAADPRTARLLAERLRELGVSAILDLQDLKPLARAMFVSNFLEGLVEAPRELWGRPALVVVDEAHIFCPQSTRSKAGEAVIDLATRGRKRGLCLVLATQRIAALHKDAAAQANNRLIGRTSQDVDVHRASEELGFLKAGQQQLRDLAVGEFFAFGPALSAAVSRVRVGPVQTTHDHEKQKTMTPPRPTAQILALLPRLADLPAESDAREQSVGDLRRQLDDMRKQLAARPSVVEAPALTTTDRGLLRSFLAVVVDGRGPLEASIKELEAVHARLRADLKEVDRIVGALGPVLGTDPVRPATVSEPPPRSTRPPAATGAAEASTSSAISKAITGPQQRILDTLRWMEQLRPHADRTLLALLAGASPASSAYANNLGALRSAGFISYPGSKLVRLTTEGQQRTRPVEPPETSADLQARLYARLPAPRVRLLEALVAQYPRPLTRTMLATRVAVACDSSAYANNLGGLRTLGLIDYPQPGHVSATELLFLPGDAVRRSETP